MRAVRELLSPSLGASLRTIEASGNALGVGEDDVRTLVVLGLIELRADQTVRLTALGRDLRIAEERGN